MKLKKYLSEKFVFISINLLVAIITIGLLKTLGLDNYPIVFIEVINLGTVLVYLIIDFIKRKNYYDSLWENLSSIDKKYFITEIIKPGDFVDSRINYEVIDQCNKSMKDEVADLARNIEEYKEYIEMWVHEIKTPIAASRLILENNPSKTSDSIIEEIEKIENYIEQVLFYARSNDLYKDYLVKKINLKKIINSVIKRNANILIEKRIKIEVDNIDENIYSDSKWIEFILQQIVINSIKYMDKPQSILKFQCSKINKKTLLSITDNGIGMDEKTIKKAFEKGYTGENGRKYCKSTGMGLYLCKKLSDKLEIEISIESKVNEWTRVNILFP